MMDWFISPNFRIGNEMHIDRQFDLGAPDFSGNEMMYQSRGHGKYIEIAALFGWDAVRKINQYYYNLGISYGVERDDFILNASKQLNINLAPLLHIWGFIPSEETLTELLAVPYSNEIKERIEHYRTIVPRNKEDFVAYFNAMIEAGKNGDGNKQRWEAMAGEGYAAYPEYSNVIADEIIAEIDTILCRYYTVNCNGVMGVEETLIAENISYFPNPTNNMLFIDSNENPVKVSIYNVLGKEVISAKNSKEIDVSGLPSGVYIIRISVGDGVHQTNRKFIKN
jgi:hypothetical protein